MNEKPLESKKIETTISVNSFSIEDIPKINQLLKQLSPNISDKDFEYFRKISEISKIIIVRNSDGEIMGMCNLIDISSIGASYSRCADLVVDENFRKQGVAEKMIKLASELSKQMKYPYMIVQTNIVNRDEAVKFYKLQGFELLPDMRLFVLKF